MNTPIDPKQFASEAAYTAPWGLTRAHMVVPDAFFSAIYSHLRGYLAPNPRQRKSARMLAVQGPAGNGKTEMAHLVCSHVGCNVLCIPGAALAGKHEGDARKVLLKSLEEATRFAGHNGRPSVVIIDDIDRSVAALRHNTGHTINSQLLVGALQDLANDRDYGATKPYLRVPFILTGNNFAGLPETLVRPGRMRFFSWEPTWRDKADMWIPQLGKLSWLDKQRLRQLVREYHDKGEPLAFFVDLFNAHNESAPEAGLDCTDILKAAATIDEHTTTAILDIGRLEHLAREMHRNKARSYVREGGEHVLA